MSQSQDPREPSNERLQVVIAGGGVAALEAAFAIQALAPDRASVNVLAADDEFIYRPLSVGEPFSRSWSTHWPLAELINQAGAELIHGALAEVAISRRVAVAADGSELPYDALLVGVGATPKAEFEHATVFDSARADELIHGLVQDIEGRYVHRLAVVLGAPMPWPLPAYEVALMASERAWDMQTDLDVTLITPESSPLAAFGPAISQELAALLAARRVEVLTSAYAEIRGSQTVTVHPGGRSIPFDRIIAFPSLQGPAILGLPEDGDGFIPVDECGRVRGADRVWAAGDASDCPIKHGGVAAQLADAAARSIALLAGADVDPRPFLPIVEGVLMTGGTSRYLRGSAAFARGGGESVFREVSRRDSPPKIAATYLAPHLEHRPVSH